MKWLLLLLSALAVGCASTGQKESTELTSGEGTSRRNALKSDYWVKSGSVLKVDYSSGSRFFVENGGKLEGFEKGLKKTQVFAEKGADLPEVLRAANYRKQVRLVEVADAGKSYEERNLPWNEEPPLVKEEGSNKVRRIYAPSYYGWGWYGDPYFYGRYYSRGIYSYPSYRSGRSYRSQSSSRGAITGARVVR